MSFKFFPIVGLLMTAIPLAYGVEDCDRNVNLNNGFSYKEISGLVTCKDRDTQTIIRKVNFKNGKRHGWEERFDVRTGKVFAREPYVENKLDGVAQYFNREKFYLERETSFRNGQIEGLAKSYYEDGSIKSIRYELTGAQYNTDIEFWPNGKLKRLSCGPQSVDKRDEQWCGRNGTVGEVILYDQQGRPEEKRSFLNNKWQGTHERYFENGQIAEQREYEAGEATGRRSTFNAAGQMLTKSEYDRKSGTGTITENFKEGQLKSTYVLRNHKVQSETHYYQNGKLREEATYQRQGKDQAVRKAVVQYSDRGVKMLEQGYLEVESPYGGNSTWRPDGPGMIYRENGSLQKKVQYKNGTLEFAELFDENGNFQKKEEYFKDGSRK
ncbi:MAG: hypothetical protein K1X48_00155 [Burkholderiaceae bacterium]|nr:hypothetical protein [Burkholderiaceae bacterium]